MSITSSQLPVELRKLLRRSRRAIVRRLPEPVTARLRFAKWAVVGPPSEASKPRPKPGHRGVPAKPVDGETSPDLAATTPDSGPIPLPGDRSTIEVRREFVFATADPQGTVLEIGPAHNGTLARRDGFQTKNVDHLDRQGLIDKYEGHAGVSPEMIEDVDYVLAPGARMADSIAEHFDLVLASHVLEHTTSLIHFVNECARLLTGTGTLALIVPDQRFCFDRFRDRSPISAVIDASLRPVDVHSMGTVTEHTLYAVNKNGGISWPPGVTGTYAWVHDLDLARRLAAESDNGEYVDVHHWVFTPHHLRLLLKDLADLGHISLREAFFHDTIGFEFYLNLTAQGAGPEMTREQLVRFADAERRVLDDPVFKSSIAGAAAANG